MADELTTRILIEIRDEIRSTRVDLGARIDLTNERLDQTNERIDQTNERLTVLAKITQGIDGRLSKMEANNAFLPRRVDILEQKVQRIEDELAIED